MKQLVLIICIAVILAALTESAGPGCAWTGCGELKVFADILIGKCSTGTGTGSGRTERIKGSKCGFLKLGGRDFCCDRNCGHQECSYTCEELGMSSWEHEVETMDCKYFDGKRWVRSVQVFCCP